MSHEQPDGEGCLPLPPPRGGGQGWSGMRRRRRHQTWRRRTAAPPAAAAGSEMQPKSSGLQHRPPVGLAPKDEIVIWTFFLILVAFTFEVTNLRLSS